jgi:hypothetical protein
MSAASLQLERKKVVDDWARYAAERLQKSIIKHKIGHSGSLSYSVLYDLKAMSTGEVTSTVHEFNYYGKFVDMGVGRGQKIEDVKTNGDLISVVGHGRRPKKWFSRTFYAEFHALGEILAKKYGEDYQRVVKESITGKDVS